MALVAQNKVDKWSINGNDPLWSGNWTQGNRPVPTLIASAALGGDGNQQFSIPGANWQTGAWNGGSLTKTGGYISMTNPANVDGGVYSLTGIECFGLGLRDFYLQFEVKYPGVVWGSKFCKLHGAAGSNGYGANCTFGQNDVGDLTYIGYGDGTQLGQDVNQTIYLDGGKYMGRNASIADWVVQPQGTYMHQNFNDHAWHKFRVHAKFNTGTSAQDEVPDGEFFLEVDDVVQCHVRNIYNRHYLNPPIAEVNIGGWTAGGAQPFELDVRNVKISTGGFV